MTKQNRIQKIKDQIIPLLNEYQIKKAGLFGSYVRGDYSDQSDIDIVVEPTYGGSGFKLVQLKRKIEQKIGASIDMITYNSIHPEIRSYIDQDHVQIL